MKRFSVALLVLLSFASAASPWNVNTMNATVTFSGDIEVSLDSPDSEMTWLESELFLSPSDGAGQEVKLLSVEPADYKIINDDFGNQIIRLRWENIEDDLHYNIVYEVVTDRFTSAITDPGDFDNISVIETYLEADNLSSWTGPMRNKALILAGDASILEASAELAEWIYNGITYNRSYWSSSLPATETFPLGQGVCDEFSHLFMAFAKSLGVPGRYVQGVVYSGESWDLHAWTEIYVAGFWLPVDPTYGEVGFIDASHIVLAKVPNDNHIRNRLSWEGYAARASFGQDLKSVKITELSNGLRLMGLELSLSETDAGLGQVVNVSAELSNYANTYMAPSCRITMPEEMVLLDEQLKISYLPPGETSQLSWRVMTPRDLQKGLIYKMPIRVSCFPSVNSTEVITVLPGVSAPESVRVSIVDATVIDSDSLRTKVRNEGNKDVTTIILSACTDACSSTELQDLESGETLTRSFSSLTLTDESTVQIRIESEEFASPGLYTMSLVGIEDSPAVSAPELIEAPQLSIEEAPKGFIIQKDDPQGIILTILALAVLLVLFAVVKSIKRHEHHH